MRWLGFVFIAFFTARQVAKFWIGKISPKSPPKSSPKSTPKSSPSSHKIALRPGLGSFCRRSLCRAGFSLLELVFVIIILGILLSFAVPKLDSSRDDAEIGRVLNNLKVFTNDLSIYALRHDALGQIRQMSNVANVDDADLSGLTGSRSLPFAVGSDKGCLSLVFVNGANGLFMGIASNERMANAIKNASSAKALDGIDFTSTSSSKTCLALSKNANFKSLAGRLYPLLGTLP